MKKPLLTLALFSVICFGSQAGKVKTVREKEDVKTVTKAVAVEEPTVVIDENTSTAAVEDRGCSECRRKHWEDGMDSKAKKCPFKEVAYSEVKEGETYLVIKEYVKGTNDAEDITPETIVTVKPSNE